MKRYLSFLVTVVFIIGIGFVAEVNSNTYLLSPTDDSWVYSYTPDKNYGSEYRHSYCHSIHVAKGIRISQVQHSGTEW